MAELFADTTTSGARFRAASSDLASGATKGYEITMEWTTPSFTDIKMDSEIGSYQADDEPSPIVESDAPPAE